MFSTTWAEAKERIVQDDAGKWDIKVPASGMYVSGGLIHTPKTKRNDAISASPSDLAVTQLCNKLSIPPSYYKQVAEDNPLLADDMINHGLNQLKIEFAQMDKTAGMYVRGNSDRIRAFLSPKYKSLDNSDIVGLVDDIIGPNMDQYSIRSFGLDDNMFVLKVTMDAFDLEDPSALQSVLKVGFYIANSETGKASVSMQPFVFRQSCTNDLLVSQSQFSQRHVTNKKKILIKMRQELTRCLSLGESTRAALIASRDIKVPSPKAKIIQFGELNKLSKKQQQSVVKAYNVEPERNMFGIVNAFTRAAQREGMEGKIAMEEIAGKILLAA